MNTRLIGYCSIIVLLAGGCGRQPHRTQFELVDVSLLLNRMTNVNTFAQAPLGDSFLESSYDRSGGNQDWAVYMQPPSDGRIQIFNAEGPGYVSRFWIASFAAERWLFFFDGEEEPRLDLSKDELFGDRFPFVPPLAGISGGGRYCLMPIPFSKSLRIEMVPVASLSQNDRNYFQINYTKLDMKPEDVVSFPRRFSSAESNLVNAVNAVFENTEDDLRSAVDPTLDDSEPVTLDPGESLVIWQDDAAGVLESFWVRIEEPLPGKTMQRELLRNLRLQFYWDGLKAPSVDVPLGDFFCNPWYYRSFSSLPLGRVDNTYICRFPMPYRRGARCEMRNSSAYPVSVRAGATGDRESSRGLDRSFHAVWRASTRTGRPLDFVEIKGGGHYVGCFLSAIGQDDSWTILEGDEYVLPDAGKQPPQLGTGLEDYFNGAYYYTSLFDLPFHGLIEKGAMRTDQYRLHMLDAVAFDNSFKAGIEFGDRNRAKGYLSSVVYWYADQSEAVQIPSDLLPLLTRPTDRYALYGLMAQLFLLERAGLYTDAASRMDFFSEYYSAQPWRDLLKVRALGYREMLDGFEAVQDGYEELLQSTFDPAAKAARNMLWLRENPTNALLGIHALANFRLKLDGVTVAEGESLNLLEVSRLQIQPGEHTWEVELAPNRQGSFFSLCLRNMQGDITSAGEWEVQEMQENAGKKPPEVFVGNEVLPNMTVWAFEPNAYVNMQSPANGIGIWKFWDASPIVKRVVLRKRFTVGSAADASGNAGEAERSEEALRAHAIN